MIALDSVQPKVGATFRRSSLAPCKNVENFRNPEEAWDKDVENLASAVAMH